MNLGTPMGITPEPIRNMQGITPEHLRGTTPTPAPVPTPRTDAVRAIAGSAIVVPADFARTLERELAKAQSECAQLSNRLSGTELERDALGARAEKAESDLAATKAALAEAQKDKERLDWLETCPLVAGSHSPFRVVTYNFNTNGKNIRLAIDAARAEREGGVK